MSHASLAVHGTERLTQPVELSSSVRIQPGDGSDVRALVVRDLRPGQKLDLRCWLDQVLLTLRLWKQGTVTCRAPRADCDPSWYIIWKTWCDSALDRPLTWDRAESELPGLWRLVAQLRNVEDHRLRRFFQFYFYPVAVDRFSMLFMAADGLLFPYPKSPQSSKVEFARRGAKLLRDSVSDRTEERVKDELIRYYEKRNGEFHGTARISGADIQASCERLEQYVRTLIIYFLQKRLLSSAKAAEGHIRCACDRD